MSHVTAAVRVQSFAPSYWIFGAGLALLVACGSSPSESNRPTGQAGEAGAFVGGGAPGAGASGASAAGGAALGGATSDASAGQGSDSALGSDRFRARISLGADFGCYRTEIKLTPTGRKIIEVNGRPSGLTPVNVKLASGLPLLQMCMRLGLGEHVVVDGPIKCDRVAYRFYCEPPMSARTYIGSSSISNEDLREVPRAQACRHY